jgi:hypothetical protein
MPADAPATNTRLDAVSAATVWGWRTVGNVAITRHR